MQAPRDPCALCSAGLSCSAVCYSLRTAVGGSESDLLSVQRLFMVQGRLRNQIVPTIATNTETGQEVEEISVGHVACEQNIPS